MGSYRQLQQTRFFLNASKPDEQELITIIAQLKTKRSFSRAIRIGLKLFWSLTQGQTDVLMKEFPWVAEQVAVRTSPLEELQARLDRIEQKIPSPEPLVTRPTTSVPVLTSEQIADTLEIKQASRGTEDPNANFRISMAKLQSDNIIEKTVEYLTLKDIEYGVKTGKLPQWALQAAQKRKSAASLAPAPSTSLGNAKPLLGAEIKITAPSFDDLDLL